jgi:translation initiation factor 4E
MLSTKEIVLLLLSSVLVSPSDSAQSRSEEDKTNTHEEQESIEIGEAVISNDSNRGAPHPQLTKQLDTKWTFWYEPKAKREKGRPLNKTDYLKEVKRGKSFDTIAAFWDCWNEVQRVCNSDDCNYELFKEGVKPAWEDPKNIKGGMCVLNTPRTAHEETMKQWVSLMITLLIGEFGPDVNGVVLSTRPWGNRFAVWVRNSKDKEGVDTVMKQLHELFGANAQIRFQRHQAAIRKKLGNDNKQPVDGEASASIEGEHRDKYKGKEQPRRRSVVTEETKGLLHNLIQEATDAPLQPPIDRVNLEHTKSEANTSSAPMKPIKLDEPMLERPTHKRRSSITSTTISKPTNRKELPKLSDFTTRDIGIGLAIAAVAVATSVLSWTYL